MPVRPNSQSAAPDSPIFLEEHHGIGWAVKQMHNGDRVARSGWNGKGMWVALQLASEMTLPYVYIKTADDKLVPWVCSQTDLLAMDWEVVRA